MGRKGQTRRMKTSMPYAEESEEPEHHYEEPIAASKVPLIETDEGPEDEETINEKIGDLMSNKTCRRLSGQLSIDDLWADLVTKFEADPNQVEAVLLQLAEKTAALAVARLKAASERSNKGIASPSRQREVGGVPTVESKVDEQCEDASHDPQCVPPLEQPILEPEGALVPQGESTVDENCEAVPEKLPDADQEDSNHDPSGVLLMDQPPPQPDAEFVPPARESMAEADCEDGTHDAAGMPVMPSLEQPHAEPEAEVVAADGCEDGWGALPLQALVAIDMASIVSLVQDAVSYVQEECAKVVSDFEQCIAEDRGRSLETSSSEEPQALPNSWFSWEAWECPCFGRRR